MFVLTLSDFPLPMALPAPTTPLPTLSTPYLDHSTQYYQGPLTTSSTWRCQNSTCAIIGKLSCTQALPSPHAGTTLRAYRNRIYDIRSAPHANRAPRRPPHDTFVGSLHAGAVLNHILSSTTTPPSLAPCIPSTVAMNNFKPSIRIYGLFQGFKFQEF